MKRDVTAERSIERGIRPYDVDCRDLAGAQLIETAEPAYVDSSILYLWTGCHPTYVAGRDPHIAWALRLAPVLGVSGLAILEGEVLHGQGALAVVCPAVEHGDEVCSSIPLDAPSCRYVKRLFRVCQLTPEQRRQLEGP